MTVQTSSPTNSRTESTIDESWGISQHHRDWVDNFQKTFGRPPRVLGIGNIANNGYKNAVAFRNHGVDCDVISADYFHAMGCPEWESATFETVGLNFDAPVWSGVINSNYERPRWFAQGNVGTCLDYLIARNEDDPRAAELWNTLSEEIDAGGHGVGTTIFKQDLPSHEMRAIGCKIAAYHNDRFDRHLDEVNLNYLYQTLFVDQPRWRRLMNYYDLILGYATSGFYPLFAGKKPYVAYEHGTIRTLPFENSLSGQLCAVSYAEAANVLITNCDNIVAAQRLQLKECRFVPHAILEAWRSTYREGGLRQQLLSQHNADFVAFHPSRQHWGPERNLNYDKGNDIFIEGFARFVKERRPRAVMIVVDWGATVADSKKLIKRLGIEDRVVWIAPLPIRSMSTYVAAADVLADQFVIGAWGALMPIGLMLGVPTLLKLNEEVHRWCFPVMPPILNAGSSEAVFDHLCSLTEAEYVQKISEESITWYDRYHSMSVVAGRLIDSLISALTPSDDLKHLRHLLLNKSADIDAKFSAVRHFLDGLQHHVLSAQHQIQSIDIQIQHLHETIAARQSATQQQIANLQQQVAHLEQMFDRVRRWLPTNWLRMVERLFKPR